MEHINKENNVELKEEYECLNKDIKDLDDANVCLKSIKDIVNSSIDISYDNLLLILKQLKRIEEYTASGKKKEHIYNLKNTIKQLMETNRINRTNIIIISKYLQFMNKLYHNII